MYAFCKTAQELSVDICTFSTHTTMEIKIWMHYAVGLCLRNHGVLFIILFIIKDLFLCFAYNCKNTVKFNNHVAFFPFLSFT